MAEPPPRKKYHLWDVCDNVDTLNGQMADAQEAIIATDEALATTNDNLATTNETLATTNGTLADAQSDISGAQGAISSAQGDISDIQSALTGKTDNSSAAIAGGTINNCAIGGTTAAAGKFTSMEFSTNETLSKTITAAGTTGAQTINKLSGSVNFAAGATSLVITNNLVTANSVVLCQVATNDTTCTSVVAVPTANTITLTPKAAPTAETKVFFRVSN